MILAIMTLCTGDPSWLGQSVPYMQRSMPGRCRSGLWYVNSQALHSCGDKYYNRDMKRKIEKEGGRKR